MYIPPLVPAGKREIAENLEKKQWGEVFMNEENMDLLDQIQIDFPLISCPYKDIGERCGLSEAEVISLIKEHISKNIVRNIAPLLQGSKLGYKSTLAAVKASPHRIDDIAASISAHPGVSHNYLREYEYNIWFSLSVSRKKDFHDEIRRILGPTDIPDFFVLPAVRTFKLHVVFTISGEKAHHEVKQEETYRQRTYHENDARGEDGVHLSHTDVALLRYMQHCIPLTPRPWKTVGDAVGITEEEVLACIRRLKNYGVIRRIAGTLRHRNIGYVANGMACFNIEPDRIEEAGKIAASFPSVSHCYERETPPKWRFPLFAMIHAKTKTESDNTAAEIARRTECRDFIVLYSIREFKKERTQYF